MKSAVPGPVQSLPQLFSGLSQPAPAPSSTIQSAAEGEGAQTLATANPSQQPPAHAAGQSQEPTDGATAMPFVTPSQQQQQQVQQELQPNRLNDIPAKGLPLSEQGNVPASPNAATNVAYMLAGLVSPEPPRQPLNRVDGNPGAITETELPETTLHVQSAGAITTGELLPKCELKQSSPVGPGQARLDMLLGIPPCSEKHPSAEQPSTAEESQGQQHAADSNAQAMSCGEHDSHVSAAEHSSDPMLHGARKDHCETANGSTEALQPGTAAQDSCAPIQWPSAKPDSNATGQPPPETDEQGLEGNAQMPFSMDSSALPDALAPVAEGERADQHHGDRQEMKQGLSPGQPSLSMAAAGCFNDFQLAPAGHAQWRYMVSGQQVRSPRQGQLPLLASYDTSCIGWQCRLDPHTLQFECYVQSGESCTSVQGMMFISPPSSGKDCVQTAYTSSPKLTSNQANSNLRFLFCQMPSWQQLLLTYWLYRCRWLP